MPKAQWWIFVIAVVATIVIGTTGILWAVDWWQNQPLEPDPVSTTITQEL